MKKLLSLLLCIAFCFPLKAKLKGRVLVDSLFKHLPSSTEDTGKVKLLNNISVALYQINPDSGIIYGEWAKKLSTDLNWRKGLGLSYLSLGLNYEAKTQNSDALENYHKANIIFDEIRDLIHKANTLGNIGNVYTSLNQLDKALMYDSTALVLFELLKDNEGRLRNYGNIAQLYQGKKNYPKAHQYYTMALDMSYKLRSLSEIAKNLGNIAGLYFDENNLKSAIEYGEKAIKMYENEGLDIKGLASNQGNMGEYYLYFATDSNITPAKKQLYLQKSMDHLKKGLALSYSIQYYAGIISIHKILADTYEQLGELPNALANIKIYYSLKDSIYSANTALKITELEAINQAENKKRQILLETIKKRDERFLYISGIILLLVIMGVVVRKFIIQVKSNRKLALEKNKHLEKIKVQSNVLMDIAHIQSHEVRGPVTTILGLSQLFNYDDISDPVNKELMEGVSTLATRLDKIITDVVNKENKLMKENLEPEEEL